MLNCDTKHSKTFAFHGMLPTATHPRLTKLPQINNTHAPSNCISIHKAAQIFINKQNTVHLFKNNCHAFARSLSASSRECTAKIACTICSNLESLIPAIKRFDN